MKDDMTIGDQAATELDRRKIKKLIDDGVISAEDIANAPILDENGNEL